MGELVSVVVVLCVVGGCIGGLWAIISRNRSEPGRTFLPSGSGHRVLAIGATLALALIVFGMIATSP